MKFEEMLKRAALYQEAAEAKNKKPQLIQESRNKIATLEKQAAALEERATKEALNQSLNKMNPLKFFAKKEEDLESQINQLEMEIKKENRKIASLENANTEEYIDLDAVTEEALQIMAGQSKVIAAHKQKVLDAQAAYHNAIEAYQDELTTQKSFAMKVRGLEEAIKKESFTPRYNGETPYIDSRLNSEGFSPDIIKSHRQRPNLKNTLFS